MSTTEAGLLDVDAASESQVRVGCVILNGMTHVAVVLAQVDGEA